MADDLAFALALADLADSITLRAFRSRDLVVETKPDLTPVSDKLSSSQIVQIVADSVNGNGIYYVAIVGSALNNHKLKIFSAGGTCFQRMNCSSLRVPMATSTSVLAHSRYAAARSSP